MHYHHFEQWFPARGWDVQEVLSPESWIRISRDDRVAQAVSWARALQTGRWSAEQRGFGPSIYRPRQIDRLLAEIDRQESGWDAFFTSRGVRPLHVTYEELTADLPATVRRVLAHLGIPGASRVPVAEAALRRQGDGRNEEWAVRYRSRREARSRSRFSSVSPRVSRR
jgi:LPS sulfotransferase NodH